MKLLLPLLYPFAVVYDLVTSARNALYERGMKPVARFDLPLLGVGNLAVGGTGKTPMVEYLIRLLRTDYRMATLSRGYGRATKGFRLAAEGESAQTIGDEPMQLYQKFGRDVVVAVGEERAFAVPWILDAHPECDLIVLDDAFQHRAIAPSFQILLTDYRKPFFRDYLLPAGRLRESRRGAARAHAVVVTKCPRSVSDDEMHELERSIRKYTNAPVFFSTLRYGAVQPVNAKDESLPDALILVTGIASPAPLEEYLRSSYRIVEHIKFTDHHKYSRRDIERICDLAKRMNAGVITTEKDLTRLGETAFASCSVALYVIPVEMEFVKNGQEFDEIVRNAAKKHAA